MVISDENYFPIMIDNIEVPLKTDMFWTLNLEERDFMLSPLFMMEELTTPILVINIMGYAVEVPADWNLLIYAEDTSQLDILEISELSRGHFTAVVFEHKKNKIHAGVISTIDYNPDYKIQTVSLHKNAMMCHPLGPDYWICLAPSDNYNKYLKNAVIGDLITLDEPRTKKKIA
jgi:hypothetical protein